MRREKYKKIVIFFSVLLTTIILFFIARIPPAEGYEISIYQVLPWYFWLAIVVSYIWGLFVSFKEIFDKENVSKNLATVPIMTLIFTTSILILIPYLRGYTTYGRSDVLSHIGFIKDILQTGTFAENWYPVLHVFGASSSEVAGINPKTIPMILPLFFFLTYLIGIYYLSKYLFKKKMALVILVISSIPIYQWRHLFFVPHTLVFFLLPLALYLFIKGSKNYAYMPLYFIFLFPFILFHPLRSIFFLIILAIFFIIVKIYKTTECRINKKVNYHNLITFTFISSMIWVFWYLLYFPAERTVRTISSFIIGIYSPGVEEYGEIAVEYSPPFRYLFQIGTFRYGVEGILLLLSIIFIFLTKTRKIKFINFIYVNQLDESKEHYLHEHKWQNTYIIFSFVFFTILTIFFFITGAPGGYARYLYYVNFFSIFLIGSFIFITKMNMSKNKVINILVVAFLISIIILSISSIYRSPLQGYQSSQVTSMEIRGMEWTFEKRNESLNIEEITGLSQERFYDAIYGRDAERENIRRKRDEKVANHFGYENNDTLGSQYDIEVYLVIAELNRIRYQELYSGWEEAQFFVEEDFEKLERDNTVNKIYSNGEFDSYYISEIGK